MPHICPVLADVGFHGCPLITLYRQQILKSTTIYTLRRQGLRFVESHICQNRADMGHPSFVTDRDLTTGRDSLTRGVCEKCGLRRCSTSCIECCRRSGRRGCSAGARADGYITKPCSLFLCVVFPTPKEWLAPVALSDEVEPSSVRLTPQPLGPKEGGYFVKFDKIWLFYRLSAAPPREAFIRGKGRPEGAWLCPERRRRRGPVAAGTQFRLTGSMRGLATLGWFRSRLGDDGSFGSLGAGSGAGSGWGTWGAAGRVGMPATGVPSLPTYRLVLLFAAPLRVRSPAP